MKPFLLDVNVLLALADPSHVKHELAHRWFQAEGRQRWATCPLTENGFVRIASHPSYPNPPGDAQVVLELLRAMCAQAGHEFWEDSLSLRSALPASLAFTHKMTTDLYLVALALHRGGCLATLDQRIPVGFARDSLLVLS